MTTHPIPDLSSQIELLIQAHISTCRKAAQEAVTRAFAAASTTNDRPCPGAKTSPPVERQSGRRDRAEIQRVSERFYEAVAANPGQTMALLAAKLGLRPQQLHRPMDLLRQARKIRSVGQRNVTKYFPMAAGEVAAA